MSDPRADAGAIALRPMVLIKTELFALPPSFRSNCGGPSRLLMTTSTSPSLSISPKQLHARYVFRQTEAPKLGADFGERPVAIVMVHEIALLVASATAGKRGH